MTYIHWMKRNGTERNHVELHYDHHQDCITLGCKSSAFISSNIIWLSVYVCEWVYNVQTGKEIDANKKRKSIGPFALFIIFFVIVPCFCEWCAAVFQFLFLHTVCDLFVLAVGSGCLCSLEISFFILSLMLSFLKGRWCTKKHMHIYSLSIYDQWVYLCFDWIVRLLSWTLEMNEETAKAENVDRKICYWNCCGAETNE